MSANVRCTGEGEYEIVRVRGTRVTWSNGGPCGWKGERLGYWNGPCPECGGQVELLSPADLTADRPNQSS